MGEFYIDMDRYGWFPNQFPDITDEPAPDLDDSQVTHRQRDDLHASALQSPSQDARRRAPSIVRLRIEGRPAVSDITVQGPSCDNLDH